MAASFLEFIFLFFFAGSSADVLSFLEPQMALEVLGEKTDEASLLALIEGGSGGAVAVGASGGAAGESGAKEASTAIQNLASSSEDIRAKARQALLAMGESVRAKLEDVVAKDPRRAEEAKKVLAELDASRVAGARKKEVARILAMHLAADRKLEKLAPAIRKLLDLKSPFVTSAARKSLGRLEGKEEPEVDRPWTRDLAALAALPAELRILLVLRAGTPKGMAQPRIDTFIKGFMSQFSMMMDGSPDEEIQNQIREGTRWLVDLVVSYGNIRIDKAALANVGNINTLGAGVGIVVTGEYEREVLEAGLAANGSVWTVAETAGRKVFTSPFVRIVPLNEHQVLVLPQQASIGFPLDAYLADLKAGKKTLGSSARWATFLETLEGETLLRGLALSDGLLAPQILDDMTGEMQQEGAPQGVIDALKGMSELELDIRELGEAKFGYRAEALFAEGQHAKDMTDYVKQGIQTGIQEIEQNMGDIAGTPFEGMAKSILELLKGIHVVAEGKRGILRGDMDQKALLAPFAIFSARTVQVQDQDEAR
jgi:hypothetical protein